jgi:hypothetical protein
MSEVLSYRSIRRDLICVMEQMRKCHLVLRGFNSVSSKLRANRCFALNSYRHSLGFEQRHRAAEQKEDG